MSLLELPISDLPDFPISRWLKNANSTHSPPKGIAANPNNFPSLPFWVISLLWGGSENRLPDWSSADRGVGLQLLFSFFWGVGVKLTLKELKIPLDFLKWPSAPKIRSEHHKIPKLSHALQEHKQATPFLPCCWVGDWRSHLATSVFSANAVSCKQLHPF